MPDRIDLSAMDTVLVDGPYGFKRLERHWEDPTSKFWDDIWKHLDEQAYLVSARRGLALGGHRDLYRKYLPPGARVLEAGCGAGQVVVSLRALGYDCYGLDFAQGTIARLRDVFRDVPFHVGDIRELPFDDKYFDSYISLGVIEHFQYGQLEMLREAARVVRSGGLIFVSVPLFNAFRYLRTWLGTYCESSSRPFFESCISLNELKYLFDRANIDLLEVLYTNPVMTFAQETCLRPVYRWIEDVRYVRGAVDRSLNLLLPSRYFGHMVMVVGRTREISW